MNRKDRPLLLDQTTLAELAARVLPAITSGGLPSQRSKEAVKLAALIWEEAGNRLKSLSESTALAHQSRVRRNPLADSLEAVEKKDDSGPALTNDQRLNIGNSKNSDALNWWNKQVPKCDQYKTVDGFRAALAEAGLKDEEISIEVPYYHRDIYAGPDTISEGQLLEWADRKKAKRAAQKKNVRSAAHRKSK